jgi:quinol monooxygenase YgiN
MVTRGLLVRLEVKSGKDDETEAFLRSAVPLVQSEPGTVAWFAVRFGRSEYGIVDFFPDDSARQAHLSGQVAAALMQRGTTLFAEPPRILKLDVLAHKLPQTPAVEPITKGLLVTFHATPGHEASVQQMLVDARALVDEEPKTAAWFAIHLETGEYGIFDVFPDVGGRFAHLTGHVPRELTKNALSLLGGLPDTELPNVIASRF